MDIVKRYIYAVVRHLPEKDKKEVEKELIVLIEEMMEEYPEEKDEVEKARLVLEKLGNPEKLADKYRGRERYLIGPRLFNKYLCILKMVLLAIFIGITVASLIGGIISKDGVESILLGYMSTLFQAILQGAAWVTIVFAIMEYQNVDLDSEFGWSLKDLPVIPNKKAVISKCESVVALVFTTIFFSILYFAPELIGIFYGKGGEVVNIPLFNTEILSGYRILLICILVIEIIQESLKLVWGVWNSKRAIISSVGTLASISLTIMVFSNMNIWNVKVGQMLFKYTGIEMATAVRTTLFIVVIFAVIDMASTLYKGFRHGN